MTTGPKIQNDVRDEDVRADRKNGMSFRDIATKYNISRQRAYTICNAGRTVRPTVDIDPDSDQACDSNWEKKLRSASDSLLRGIIRLGLRRIYYPAAGEPDGIPDMPPDDIRARARELGLLQ